MPRDPDFNDSIAALVEAGGLRVALGPLDEPAVHALVEAILDTAADEQLLRWTRGAGGNPLFVTELVRSAQDPGRLAIVEHRAVLSGDSLPRALSVLLDRRIAGLTPETADVLKVASVLSDAFAPHILAAVMGRSTAAVLPALDEAIQVEVLFSRGSGLVFRHDLVRQAVYRRIPAALQSSLHLEAASVLSAADAPADVVAAHLLRSGDDPAAVAMLREAAEKLAGSAPSAAADLLDRALELMPAGHPDRASTAVSLVRLLAWAGRPAQAAARAEDALAAGLDAAAEARLRVGLAEAMIFRVCRSGCSSSSPALAVWTVSPTPSWRRCWSPRRTRGCLRASWTRSSRTSVTRSRRRIGWVTKRLRASRCSRGRSGCAAGDCWMSRCARPRRRLRARTTGLSRPATAIRGCSWRRRCSRLGEWGRLMRPT